MLKTCKREGFDITDNCFDLIGNAYAGRVCVSDSGYFISGG
jgi:hypothetical protein